MPLITSQIRSPHLSSEAVSRGRATVAYLPSTLKTKYLNNILIGTTPILTGRGRGADRGLRGIAFDGDDIYIAASDELFCFDKNFKLRHSKKNRYLKHCHEICRMGRKLLLTSTGHDCILAYDPRREDFCLGISLAKNSGRLGWIHVRSSPGLRPR